MPLMIESTELLLNTARKDVKLKSDYQDELNQYLVLLIGFLNNFIYNNKKNQVGPHSYPIINRHIEIHLLEGLLFAGVRVGLSLSPWPHLLPSRINISMSL